MHGARYVSATSFSNYAKLTFRQRWLHWLGWLALAVIACTYSQQASASDTCTPNGWSGPTRCLPIDPTDFKYTDNTGAAPGSVPFPGNFKSLSAFTHALEQ